VLHRLRIRAKLTLVAAVPLLCLFALVVAGSVVRATEVTRASQLADEVRLSVGVTNLVHELQRERGLSSGLVGGGFQPSDRQRVNDQRLAVDVARRLLVDSITRFGQNRAGRAIEAPMAGLSGIDQHRSAVDGRRLDVAGTLRWYTDSIDQFLGATAMLAESATDTDLLSQLTAYGALAKAKEAAALERGMMNGVFGVGSFSGDQYAQFLTLVATQRAQRDVFAADATEAQRQALDAALVSSEITRATELEGQATSRPTGPLGVRPVEWWDLMTVKIDRYRVVEQRLASDVLQVADAQAATARLQMGLFLAAGIGLVLVSAGVVAVTARALSRPMRALTDRAYRSAQVDLPRAIKSLQNMGPGAMADELPSIEVASHDEVADLATAFNSVQQVAVDLAVDQAMLRRNVAEMFINLGRRNQALIGRQLAFIDRLERDEADPDQLDKLFRLDHMTTRMRRNAESLLVLAGAELPRRWNSAVPMADVVRAGLSEIEDYARVELADLGDTAVAGSVATDLTHLLAELLENATAFSPPSSKVEVHGARRAEGYLLAVVDHGIGMSPAQLADANARIDELARFDRSPSKLLGLYVVGRLAARHGISVRLLESVTSGVTAKVLIPGTLLQQMAAPALPRVDVTETRALVGAVAGGGGDRAPRSGPVGVAGPPLQRRVRRSPTGGPGAAGDAGRNPRRAAASVAVARVGDADPGPDDPEGPSAISATGEHSLRALRKRVRGAQLPDVGTARGGFPAPANRTAGDVGASLGAFQAAVDRGRRAALASPAPSPPATGTDQFTS
jgi:signal transduction histidine kinase